MTKPKKPLSDSLIPIFVCVALFIGHTTFGQEFFEEDMYVATIYSDTTTITFNHVTFGQDDDKFCVKADIIRCFTELKSLPTLDQYLGTMTSSIGDKYILRITHDGEHMTVSLTNVSGQYPHLIFTTRPPK